MTRPVFVPVSTMDARHAATYLRERGWQVVPDETLPFGVICFAPDTAPASDGWRLRQAVIEQTERDLHALFDYLEQQEYLPPREHPDAEHPTDHR